MTSQIVDTTYLLPETIQNPFWNSKENEYLFTGRSFSYIPPNIERTQQFWENIKIAKELIVEVQKTIPISANFLQRSKDYFSALNWPQPVFYSYTDRILSISIDPSFLTDWPDFTDCTLNQKMSNFQQLISSHNTSPRIALAYLFIAMAHEKNQILRTGNCAIMANVATIIGNSLCSVEKISIENGDHAACVIGRDPNSSKTDYTTWGENAVICDPWSSACFAATEVPSHLFNYKNVSQDGRHPVVEQYDSSQHLLIVSTIQPTKISTTSLQLALSSGQSDYIQLLLTALSSDNLQRLFSESAYTGRFDIIYSIIHSERFKEIAEDHIGEAFFYAVQKKESPTINALINSAQFKDISSYYIEKAFQLAASENEIAILNAIIHSERFKDIASRYIEKVFESAAIEGHITILNALINSERFKDISSNYIEKAFNVTICKGDIAIFNALINSERAKEISLNCIANAFQFTASEEDITIFNALINSERFKEISPQSLETALSVLNTAQESKIVNASDFVQFDG
jgi:hypothetical protein